MRMVLQAGQAVTLIADGPRAHRLPGNPVPGRNLGLRQTAPYLRDRMKPLRAQDT